MAAGFLFAVRAFVYFFLSANARALFHLMGSSSPREKAYQNFYTFNRWANKQISATARAAPGINCTIRIATTSFSFYAGKTRRRVLHFKNFQHSSVREGYSHIQAT
jgi:hypothetical protein